MMTYPDHMADHDRDEIRSVPTYAPEVTDELQALNALTRMDPSPAAHRHRCILNGGDRDGQELMAQQLLERIELTVWSGPDLGARIITYDLMIINGEPSQDSLGRYRYQYQWDLDR